jgi:hypothetical protein
MGSSTLRRDDFDIHYVDDLAANHLFRPRNHAQVHGAAPRHCHGLVEMILELESANPRIEARLNLLQAVRSTSRSAPCSN